MPTYLIEREIPERASCPTTLRGITQKSNEVVDGLNRPYTWRHSYVAGDKIYCVHDAERAEDVLEHARCGGFPANLVRRALGRVRQHRSPGPSRLSPPAADGRPRRAAIARGPRPSVRSDRDAGDHRRIAEQLVLSTRTVDMHVRSILTKLRCRTRTEAAGRAAELGLLTG